MAQLPMIMVGRAKFFKENPTLGNVRSPFLSRSRRSCQLTLFLADRLLAGASRRLPSPRRDVRMISNWSMTDFGAYRSHQGVPLGGWPSTFSLPSGQVPAALRASLPINRVNLIFHPIPTSQSRIAPHSLSIIFVRFLSPHSFRRNSDLLRIPSLEVDFDPVLSFSSSLTYISSSLSSPEKTGSIHGAFAYYSLQCSFHVVLAPSLAALGLCFNGSIWFCGIVSHNLFGPAGGDYDTPAEGMTARVRRSYIEPMWSNRVQLQGGLLHFPQGLLPRRAV